MLIVKVWFIFISSYDFKHQYNIYHTTTHTVAHVALRHQATTYSKTPNSWNDKKQNMFFVPQTAFLFHFS